MSSHADLKAYLGQQDLRFVIAADAETRVHRKKGSEIVAHIPAGGVSIALDPIARAASSTYISRGKTEEDRKVLDKSNKIKIASGTDEYILKRLFITREEEDAYYYGFANQTLWPLCHVTFEPPEFRDEWFAVYKKINQRFADSIRQEIKGKTFIWVNDYQLALVPQYLNKPKNAIVAMFWHIPWPTWEVFRILPQKKELLESFLCCDFIGFHRGYQMRNFVRTVERELEVRVDRETYTIYYRDHATRVDSLPLGVDTDVIRNLAEKSEETDFLSKMVRSVLTVKPEKKENAVDSLFEKQKVIIGVDRLDYTKGLLLRLRAIDRFFERNPGLIGKVSYLGIIAPSREPIPSYAALKKQVKEKANEVNTKYKRNDWEPVRLLHEVFPRRDIIHFYQKADVCLVTPRDDGMNLVSKEFALAASLSDNPGMLVLSQFAGSAMDLSQAVIINPYDYEEVAAAIKRALFMDKKEKRDRMQAMAVTLEERNSYAWAQEFVKKALAASRK